MKRIVIFISVNLAIILALFLLLEGAVRLIGGDRINEQGTSANLYQDSVYAASPGWKPGITGTSFGADIRINSLGLRGAEISLSPARRVLLLIGDSVLFGVGVEEDSTISARMQRFLDHDSTLVVNTAVIGYSLRDYQNVTAYWLNRIQPQRVLLFYTLNDIYAEPPRLMSHRQFRLLEWILSALRKHSRAYLWLKGGLLDRAKAYFDYDYNFYRDPRRLAQADSAFARIDSLCHAHQTQLEVVLLPYRHQFNRGPEESWLPQTKLAELLQKRGIPFVDARGAFTGEDRIEENYLFGDAMHFSASGCRKIAEFMARHLASAPNH